MQVNERILRYNKGRDPELALRKFARMAQTPFIFFRGSAHLFYQDWDGGKSLDTAPRSWICGDLHLENFGSYKGDNRLAYFDLNDFDEAALAPCTWEAARFLVSLHVASHELGFGAREAQKLAREFVAIYAQTLADGKARWIERSLAIGVIAELLEQVARRKRKAFLNRRSHIIGKQRQFIVDGEHLLPLDKSVRESLMEWFERFAAQQPEAKFFRVLDLARRVAGTGSLGLPRYAALVRGAGSPNRNYLLDMKQAGDSSVGTRLAALQPNWATQAERIVTVQRRSQAIAPAFLKAVKFRGKGFVLKELQPIDDRLDLAAVCTRPTRLAEVIASMGRLVAWSALRGSGRQGAANGDALSAFGHEREWRKHLLSYSQHYAAKVTADWRTFREAWSDGALKKI